MKTIVQRLFVRNSVFCLLLAISAFGGCRRTDVREFTVAIPALERTDDVKITSALSVYSGVDVRSCRFDFEKKTLTLKYDSMKIARANILQAIEAKGIKVVFPEVKGGYAGYLNEKSK